LDTEENMGEPNNFVVQLSAEDKEKAAAAKAANAKR
jgi:hypothetical protein